MEETEENKSWWGLILSLLFILIVMGLLIFYWFIPVKTFEFSGPDNSNFTSGSNSTMQFYPNMRFPDSDISYRIYDCPLQKENDMKLAFEIISNKTSLEFFPVESGEEISVTCESRNRLEGNLFIAGEGGPVNITATDKFSVIFNGQILLIKDSQCENPNVAIHELLHVLGFEHSENPSNIMYNISNCKQTIGDDTIEFINKLYLIPDYADLSFEDAIASMNGRYLTAEISVRNNGLKNAGETKLEIYADDNLVDEIDFEPIEVGYGKSVLITNIKILQVNIQEIKFVIKSNFNEIDKENNEIILKIKNEE